MKNENVSINIRPAANGWIINQGTGLMSVASKDYVFETMDSLFKFVAEFYGESKPDAPTATPDDPEHNPDALTPDQVGVKDGWRLLRNSEISNPQSHNVFWWAGSGWNPVFLLSSSYAMSNTYRTKLPFGQL